MKFKKLILYIRLFFANEKMKVYLYNKYLGIQFGENVRIMHYPRFGSEPFLIKIGDNVTITRGVAFVNHDGGVVLFRKEYPGLNFYGKIEVGNNVFIGINTIILPNVKIGNNVVIGAGSIVNRDVPDNVVIAGVPARIISNIDEYREKMLQKSLQIKFKNENERKFLIEKYINKGYNI